MRISKHFDAYYILNKIQYATFSWMVNQVVVLKTTFRNLFLRLVGKYHSKEFMGQQG